MRKSTRTAAPEADTRRRLLEAAGQVFAEAGFRGATIRKISARAGVNVALVNYHFRDKQGLYLEVLKESVRAARLEAVYQVLGEEAPPEELLRRAIRVRMESLSSLELPDQHVRIFIHELAQPSPALSRVVSESTRPMYHRLLELIGRLLDLPAEHERTRLCTNSILGQIILYAMAGPMLARLWPGLKMTPEQVERISEHIAEFSLAYLRQARASEASPK